MTARDVAHEVLKRVGREQAYANLTLGAALRQYQLSPEERRLTTELVYGVLRHQKRLDHGIQRHARQKLSRLDPDVLDLLRIAAYQLLMLDRIPAYAAVDHAVGMVKRLRGPKVAGFANAVLRKLNDRGPGALPTTPLQRLGVEGSLPVELARYWHEHLGADEAGALARSLLQRAPLCVRVNKIKIDGKALERRLEQEGVEVARGQLGVGLELSTSERPFELPSFVDGLWTAQDPAAQLVSIAVDPRPGETVLDACAGVGGKSTHLAELMENRGRLVCVDSNPRKLELLNEHCGRLGVEICERRDADLRQQAVAGLQAHRVLVDAPCTGLGVLRRHPELKWRPGAGLEALPQLVKLQQELLEAALNVLRPGGTLVYSVCTLTDEEGPDQVRWLCHRHSDLRPAPFASGPLCEAGISDGVGRLWPHHSGTDGFFIARLRRMQ